MAGRPVGLPVRRSNREPCSQHSIVQSSTSPSDSETLAWRAGVVDGVDVAGAVAHDRHPDAVDVRRDGADLGQVGDASRRGRSVSGLAHACDRLGAGAAPIDSASSASMAAIRRSCTVGDADPLDDVGEEAAHDQARASSSGMPRACR